jgi:hypothetical protein
MLPVNIFNIQGIGRQSTAPILLIYMFFLLLNPVCTLSVSSNKKVLSTKGVVGLDDKCFTKYKIVNFLDISKLGNFISLLLIFIYLQMFFFGGGGQGEGRRGGGGQAPSN